MKVLITCPPMLAQMDEFIPLFQEKGIEFDCPEVIQTLSTEALKKRLPHYEGWIAGDDLATAEVLEAGRAGRLRALVKWGVGIDNIDLSAVQSLGLSFTNTPRMFGSEVADIATGYVIGLARQTFAIDRAVRHGEWIKPTGISLAKKIVAIIGFGDIGQQTAKRLLAADMTILAYDPYIKEIPSSLASVTLVDWPKRLGEADFVVLTCALTAHNRHLLNAEVLAVMKQGVRIVNVARGALIDEIALASALDSGQVYSAALDVFETEPLPMTSPLRDCERCIFGTHNASNTIDAVRRASYRSIEELFKFLGVD